ncbi:MAG: TetR/AcrR family transcriptional regulator [Mycobacterium sp.]
MARTRARVLAAAREVFAERGIAAAALEEIADRAGYSRGAVYANFSAKEDLALAVLDDWLDEQITASEQIYDTGSTRTVMDKLATYEGNRFADRQKFMLLSEFRLHAIRNPHWRERLADLERRTLEWYASTITVMAQRAGTELPAPAQQLALMVLGMENGIATLAHLMTGEVEHHAFVDALGLLTRLLDTHTLKAKGPQ